MRENVKRLTLRLTAPEYSHLQRLAQVSGMKMEPLIRQLILGVELRPRPPDEYAALLRELSAIGNNVNQIARRCNETGNLYGEDVEDLRKGYVEVQKGILELVQKFAGM